MSILIIAEKPSLGRNIAAGIGKMQKHDGYLEGNGYIITWAFGHLFSLCDIEAYTGSQSKRWQLEGLPCIPNQFKFELKHDSDGKVDSGVKKQFMTIRKLCRREDVDTIVNAGDADREGEIIVRLCVGNAIGAKGIAQKRFMRLWLPDQTPQTVRSALAEMKPESEYDRLANEGYARTYIDWLYGVNLTRYATIRAGSLLRVGRVIVPIVRAIYDRDMEIRNFVPDKYYAVASKTEHDGVPIELTSKKKFSPTEYDKAVSYADKLNSVPARVVSVTQKRDTLNPGKLYSLSKLQNVLGKKYKMSMKESLDIVQGLYEKGYLSYPRTNSEYLATAEQDKVKQIIGICKNLGYNVEFKFKKSIFDDAKIESHSALTPTYKIPDRSKLSEREFQVYSTVFRRFVAVFCSEDCVVIKTTVKLDCGNGTESFTVKGTVMLEKGWTAYDDYSSKDKLLPKLSEGDEVNVSFAPTEKETQPPKHYTIETLNSYLKNPFKDEKKSASAKKRDEDEDADTLENDDAEYKAMLSGLELGTEATRTGIIDNARKSGYIALTKDVYTILPMGEYMIESLSRMGIGMDKYKTAEVGMSLKKVYRGECEIADSVAVAEREIRGIFAAKTDFVPSPPPFASRNGGDEDTGVVVGKCPLCGLSVTQRKFRFACEKYGDGCNFSIGNKICGLNIASDVISRMLETGSSGLIEGFTSKSGKKFSAVLKLDAGKLKFEFPKQDSSVTSNTTETNNENADAGGAV